MNRLAPVACSGEKVRQGIFAWERDPIMVAALLSPCRIKKNRLRWRRCTSARTVYAYVGGNPISFIDPLGLRECYYTQAGLNEALDQVHPEVYLLGVGRLAYAGLAKAIPAIAGTVESTTIRQAAFGVAARNSLKDLFRGPLAPIFAGIRQPSFQAQMEKYGFDAATVLSKSAATNATLNTGAAAAVAATAAAGAANKSNSSPCFCKD